MSNLVDHAKREFLAAGYIPLDQEQEDGPNKWIQESVLELLRVFSDQGHSGFSAPHCIGLFQKLANFEPLIPLQGTDDEWNDVSDSSGGTTFQNNRCSHVFKGNPDRFNGGAYDIDGKIFWEWCERDLEEDEEGYPGKSVFKSYYTSRDSLVPVTFPYTPVREYVYRQPCPEVGKREQTEEGFVE